MKPLPSFLSLSPEKKEIHSSKDVRMGIKDQDGKKDLFKMHWSYCAEDNQIQENRTLSQLPSNIIKEKSVIKTKGFNFNFSASNKTNSTKRKNQYPIIVRDKNALGNPFSKSEKTVKNENKYIY